MIFNTANKSKKMDFNKEKIMLSTIPKNNNGLYLKKDIEKLGLPIFAANESDSNLYFSKTRLLKEQQYQLNAQERLNPHAFVRARFGYYPVWNIKKINMD